ncbi:MAG TPA: VWA domain-containing protein [Acidimicrobiia bacterium]
MPFRRGSRSRRSAERGFRYSRWDGTQVGFDLDADSLLSEMSDDLLYHGDLNAALRRLLQQGFRDRNGEELMGMRDMLERLRQRRREELERRDLGGVYDDVAEKLNEVVDQERAGIDRRVDEARESGDRRRQEIVDDLAAERRRQLDELPPDLANKVQALQNYEFMDDAARERFEELMDALRQQLMQSYFNQLSEGMQDVSPERMQRMKDMLADLNHMLEQRERGEEPDFDGFMAKYGDFFPGNPRNLDELLEQMAQSMAQMQSLLNSMTPEQRAQLQGLAQALLEDLDLRWQVDELARNLQRAFPDMPWNQRMNFSGDDPLQFAQMSGLLEALGDMDDLENLLRSATQPGELAEVDLDKARELLGDDAARSLERLAELARLLEEAGLIEQREGRFELTPRGIRAIGQKALGDLFRKLLKDRAGRHEVERAGEGDERAFEHKPYEFGDPFHLNVEETVKNAIWREGAGTPVHLQPRDFEVERTELVTRSATVLLLDVSLSMPMRDNFLAAKKVAMALHALITSQFPRDYFGLVSFGRVAREVKPELLPEMSWDFEWGTNMQHALLLARKQLARQPGTKQVIMVTDGEPTAHILPSGEPYFQYPPAAETIEETLKEVMRCTREGVRINTFMLDESYYLRSFVERMMKMNKGRAFFTSPDTLGDYVLVDFLEHRRQARRAS